VIADELEEIPEVIEPMYRQLLTKMKETQAE
jgi:hypothetical protein